MVRGSAADDGPDNPSRRVLIRLQVEKHGGMPTDGVLVNGDSGNDVELFAVPGVRGAATKSREPTEAQPRLSLFLCRLDCPDMLVKAADPGATRRLGSLPPRASHGAFRLRSGSVSQPVHGLSWLSPLPNILSAAGAGDDGGQRTPRAARVVRSPRLGEHFPGAFPYLTPSRTAHQQLTAAFVS